MHVQNSNYTFGALINLSTRAGVLLILKEDSIASRMNVISRHIESRYRRLYQSCAVGSRVFMIVFVCKESNG